MSMALVSPIVRGAFLLGVLVAVSGCVTSSSRPEPPETNKEDAARYNLELGISYLRQNNLQVAREKLERAIREEPGLARAHAVLGIVFERLEDPKGAEREYRRAVDLDRSDPDSLNLLAIFTCSRKEEPREALKLFDRAIAVPLSVKAANRPMLYTNAGTCAKGVNPALAESYLRAALNLDPRFADALFQMADVSLERGNALQARGFLERYLAQGKATPAALWLGVRIEESLSDTKAARRYGDQLREDFPESAETRQMFEQSRSRG